MKKLVINGVIAVPSPPSRSINHVYSDSEIKKIGDKHITEFNYPNKSLFGYQVRFKAGAKNRFFSAKKYGSMRAAKAEAKKYRNECLRSGKAKTRPAGILMGQSDVVRPLSETGSPKLKPIIVALEVMMKHDFEIISQAKIFFDVAFNEGSGSPEISVKNTKLTKNLKRNLMLMSQKKAEKVGRSVHGVLNRSGKRSRAGYSYFLSAKGKRVLNNIMVTQESRRECLRTDEEIVTYENDPRLSNIYQAICTAIDAGFISIYQFTNFLKAVLYEGSSASSITGEWSNHPVTVSFRSSLHNMAIDQPYRSGYEGLKLVSVVRTRCEDNLTKEIRISSKGRRLAKKLVENCI